MHRSPTERQPSPPPRSAFPLQPDPGIPASAFSNAPYPTVTRRTANGVSKPPSSSSSDISATAAAVSSLALDNNHDPPSTNPPVTRAQRIVLNPPLDNNVPNADPDPAAPGAPTDTVPLLVKDLDGSMRQLNVPADMNVDKIHKMLLDESGVPNPDGYKLSFGDTDIEPGVALSKTNVIPAYTHATSLLQVIGSGRLQPQKTAQALDSVCGVVRQLSNGVTDIDTLCAAATSSLEDSVPPFTSEAPADQVAEAPTGLNDVFPSDSARENAFAAAEGASNQWGESPSPAALVRNLSRVMPNHFVRGASEEFVNNNSFIADFNMGMSGFGDTVDLPGFDDNVPAVEQTARDAPAATQPHITDIARIRRARQAIADSANGSADGALVHTGPISNLAVPQLDITPTTFAAAAASGYGNGQAVVARSGEGTWMDDIKTTWEAGLVRNSGVLGKTPTGKDLDAQFKALDVEMQDEQTEIGYSDSSDHDNSTTSSATASAASAAGAQSAMDVDEQAKPKPSGTPSQPPSEPAPQSAKSSQSAPAAQTQPTVPAPPVPASAPVSAANSSSTGNTSGSPAQPAITRKPTLIAPSPPPLLSRFAQQPFPVASKPCIPLRRGRRPKNPHHTPEERLQRRKEQKRASARQARIRKKSMEDDYQQKVRTLLGENNNLKMQVADLSHRLECLQGLLTVSLKPVNQPGNPRPLYPLRTSTVPQQAAVPQFRLRPTQQVAAQGGNFQMPFMGGQQPSANQQSAFAQRQPLHGGSQQNGRQQPSALSQQPNAQSSLRPFPQGQPPNCTGQPQFR